jgi:hypothetical protein
MARIRVGKPDTTPDATAHTKGVHQGNAPGAYAKQIGHHADGTADARRSTGIARHAQPAAGLRRSAVYLPKWVLLLPVAVVGLLAWKELPALTRYFKIARM